MAKPVVFVATGGKPVVVVSSGGLPVTEVTTLGQPVTEVTSLGMPVTRVAAEGVSGWAPTFTANGGTGWLSYDGTGAGSDTSYFDFAFLVNSLDTNPASTCRFFGIASGRITVVFGAGGGLTVALVNSSATTLLSWASTAAQDDAGNWLFRLKANLTGTPTFEVVKSEVSEDSPGVWSAGAFASVAGTASVGPTAGTIHNTRATSGNDIAFLATPTGTSICNLGLAYVWWGQAEPLADSAFVSGGVLVDPSTIGSPVVRIIAPTLTDDTGSANKTFVAEGTWP